jgi:hypothetical protein
MDPDELLGRGGAYILDVLTWVDGDEDRWRLLILEDAGELIAADARAVTGQALSRLLNVADGLLGQGTRTLLLITTNEPVRPAASRGAPAGPLPRRHRVHGPLPDKANTWLAARGHDRRVDRPTPLAELFGHAEAGPREAEATSIAFGFARRAQ